MQHEDVIMKAIMELFKGDAVKFFGIDKRIISATRTELSHIQVQKNIDDWALYADDNTLLHLEFQSSYDKADLARFMVSDAMLYFKERKPIRTIVVYSADITDTITTLDAGAIQYSVDAFYMSTLDGDKTYADIKAKIDAGVPLVKQDLMSIVFLPLMKNSVDKDTRLEQAIMLSKTLPDKNEQTQIQAMLGLLAEKFVKDPAVLKRLKELMSVGAIFDMVREDAMSDKAIEIAKNMLRDGVGISVISKYTGLPESIVRDLKSELDKEPEQDQAAVV